MDLKSIPEQIVITQPEWRVPTIWWKSKEVWISAAREPKNWLMVRNSPLTGIKGLPKTVVLNFWLEFQKNDITIFRAEFSNFLAKW